MDRRAFIKMLASGTAVGTSFAKSLYAQTPSSQIAAGQVPVSRQGLPADWRLVVPNQWSKVETQIHEAVINVTNGSTHSVTIAGAQIVPSGNIVLGVVEPNGDSVDIPPALGGIVLDADEALSLAVLNRDFNPFISNPSGPEAKPLVGEMQKPSEIFQGKLFIPARYLIAKTLENSGLPADLSNALLKEISETIVMRTPAHQFKLDNKLGNRIVFYNGTSPGHSQIDRLIVEMSKRNMRVVKQMVHFDVPAQGGSPESIIKDGVGGATHAGGFSQGTDSAGKAISVKSDWPSNYGRLGDNNVNYNAHLYAIDYSMGTKHPIPEPMLAAYRSNADMWDCCAAMLVPFASGDLNPAWRSYQFNPLEVFDQPSARKVALALSDFDSDKFLQRHGAFYCAEGQYVVANLGPQEDADGGTLLKKSRFGNSAFGQRITKFSEAPGYRQMSAVQRRARPDIGWKYLKQIGLGNGGISSSQYDALVETDRTAIFLEWLPEAIKGWQSYEPKDRDGLVARPMTVATMAWGLFRRYLPRERVAASCTAELLRVHRVGSEQAKSAVVALANGQDPASPGGRIVLAGLSMKAAVGLLLGLLSSEEVRNSLLNQAGFSEITSQQDKDSVRAAYSELLTVLTNADYSTQESLDHALLEADEKLAKLEVTRNFYNPITRRRIPTKTTLMKYAAPASFGIWAQFPFMAGTGCIRYVATALHTEQRKA